MNKVESFKKREPHEIYIFRLHRQILHADKIFTPADNSIKILTMETTLKRKDLVIGSIIAILMASIFSFVGGLPLMITFVPGIIFAWVAFFYIYLKRIEFPDISTFLPLYCIVFSWQFIHFGEEFLTDFKTRFPVMYDTSAYSYVKFVSINMISYFVFLVSCVIFLKTNLKFFLFPVLFFITYGAIGNAIAHPTWSVKASGYFPGLFTSLVYWIIGPYILYKLIPNRKFTIIFIALFASVLIPLLMIF